MKVPEISLVPVGIFFFRGKDEGVTLQDLKPATDYHARLVINENIFSIIN